MLELPVVLGGLLVGFVVGLTGMGGGALMTPMLILCFGVNPLAAVSSDVVAAAVMKPFGGAVHSKQGTVNWRIVRFLLLGSVPSAFAGVLLLRCLAERGPIESLVKSTLGIALLLVALVLVARAGGFLRKASSQEGSIVVRRSATVAVGVLGGLVVGMTSVGSGSLMIVALLLLYPRLQLRELVGTDLVQAVPLVASAALAHILFGEFQLGITTSIVVGSIPGVVLGARLSSRCSDSWIRPALSAVLVASGTKLLGGSIPWVIGVSVGAVALSLGITARHRLLALAVDHG